MLLEMFQCRTYWIIREGEIMENKIDIAIISDKEEVILFNAIGLKTFKVNTPFEVERAIYELSSNKCKIIYVSEALYLKIPETIEKYKQSPFPIIIPLPVGDENFNVGRKEIGRAHV